MNKYTDILTYLQDKHTVVFSDAQKAVIKDKNKVVVTLAVPGSGKTTVLVAHIADLMLGKQVSPKQILALSYNRESAKSLDRKFEAFFGEIFPDKPRFSTIHSFAYTVVRHYAASSGKTPPELLSGEGEGKSAHSLLRACLLEVTRQYPEEDLVADMMSQISLWANAMGDSSTQDHPHYFESLFALYKQKKQELGVMDFDDLLVFCHQILKSRPAILEKYSLLYPYIYLDEAQDSSRLQLTILTMLTARSKLFFVVGDEDQSIYSFRGAQPEAMQNLIKENAIVPHKMELNFRSTAQIIKYANNLIAYNTGRVAKNMQGLREGATVAVTPLQNTDELAAHICQKIAEVSHPQTAAILYRNTASAIVVADSLTKNGMQFYAKDSRGGVLKSGVVEDILNIFSLFKPVYDLEKFRKVYYKIGAYISKDTFEKAAYAYTQDESIDEMLVRLKRHGASTAKIKLLEFTFRNKQNAPPVDILHSILYDLEYLSHLKNRSDKQQFFELSAQQLRALEYLAATAGTIAEFEARIENINLVFHNASQNYGSNITLSTIHSAKGLEFDRVYVIDMQEGILPAANSLLNMPGAKTLLEEERRLCYVAITRAKTELELLYLKSYAGSKLTPSRFLNEIYAQKDAYLDEAYPGRAVYHRFFGAGEIAGVDAENKVFEIHFKKGGTKKFVLSVLEEQEIIKFS